MIFGEFDLGKTIITQRKGLRAPRITVKGPYIVMFTLRHSPRV